jgi:uncharacterized membrane protein (DUF106 family)
VWYLEPAIVILATTIVLAAITKVLQRKLIDRKKMLEMQKNIKEDQKKFNQLLKEADKNQKEVSELQAKMMKQNMEMMNTNMKLSMFTLPAFLIAFWALGALYTGKNLESIIPLPTFHDFFLLNPLSWWPTGFSTLTGYYKMYFFYYFISAIGINLVEKAYDRVAKNDIVKKELMAAENKNQ